MTRRRGAYVALTGLALALLAGAANLRPRIVYNPSDSAPHGFYLITAVETLSAGDVVAARLPAEAETLAAERGYLPAGVPIIKTVWAVSGDRVCVEDRHLSAPSRPGLTTLETDRAGRPMPHWNGCRTLGPDEVFLASNAVPYSFDGRYFGPVSTALVVGRARLIWPRVGGREP